MAKKYSIQMLWGNINTNPPDYKIALDSLDEQEGNADYLWNKLSDRNKVGISTELEKNKNLVPCELSENKIVLSSRDESGQPSEYSDSVILVDSYNIIDSTNLISLSGSSSTTMDYVCFPIQLSTGQIRNIQIQQAQKSSYGTMTQVNIGIYTNDKPGLVGSRLLWGSAGEYEFNSNGELSFYDSSTGTCSGPVITGYSTVDEKQVHNTFFYVVLGALGKSDGGYKILGYKNEAGFDLILEANTGKNIGKIASVPRNEKFHETFDYELMDDIGSLIIPYIGIAQII